MITRNKRESCAVYPSHNDGTDDGTDDDTINYNDDYDDGDVGFRRHQFLDGL